MAEFNVRDYGATGRGIDDDTCAFQKAANALNDARGGTILIPPGEYKVGRQHLAGQPSQGYAWQPEPILQIHDCTGEVIIQGGGENETVLKAAPGLRYGAFEPILGLPVDTSASYQWPNPKGSIFVDKSFTASAYTGMIELIQNQGPVTVRDLTLDGNIANLTLGGWWSDPSYQLGATGINAVDNASLTIERVSSHHHGYDGIALAWPYTDPPDGTPNEPFSHVLRDVTCYDNAQCGLAWLGGMGLLAEHCKFNRSGQTRFMTTPACGLDIEFQNAHCRYGRFYDCEFVDAASWGMISDIGPNDPVDVSVDVEFHGCTFTSRSVAVAPKRPGISFHECRIYGACVKTFGSSNPELAVKFFGCHFEDLGFEDFPWTGLVETAGDNVLFDGCTFLGNKTRPFYVIDDMTTMRLRDSAVLHRWVIPPDNPRPYQSLLQGVRLERVTFHEELPVPPDTKPGCEQRWYIATGGNLHTTDVIVTGPWVHWASVDGPTGPIPDVP
jgi:Pectate lyase superfamily protein